MDRRKLLDRLEQRLRSLLGLGREELEAEMRAGLFQDAGDVHVNTPSFRTVHTIIIANSTICHREERFPATRRSRVSRALLNRFDNPSRAFQDEHRNFDSGFLWRRDAGQIRAASDCWRLLY